MTRLLRLVVVLSSLSWLTTAMHAATPSDPGNPLVAPWAGPHGGVPPFDRVRTADFGPALEAAMAEQLEAIGRITSDPAPPSFDNTIAALERSARAMERVQTVYGVYTGCMSDDALRAVERDMAPKLAAFADRVFQDDKLFARIAAVYEARERSGLTPEQQRLTWLTFTDFVRAGARLDAAAKRELSAINQKLAELSTRFAQNLLADETDQVVFLDDAADTAGLPADVVAAAAAAAAARGKPGQWAIQNTRSSVEPFLTYASRRDLREKVWRMFVDRGDGGGAT
ncbi:MAG: M3 family peptidase, partial [Pirellulales bacterium]